MSKSLATTATLAFIISMILMGCDTKPGIPRTASWDKPQAISVDKNDAEELAAVTDMETARSNYKYRLEVLRGFYHKVGNLDKWKWSDSEFKNISQAKLFQWENVPDIVAPAGESLTNADERLLVEYAVSARNQYISCVQKVVRIYDDKRDTFKASVIRNMQDRLDPVRQYPYFPEAMLPPRDMKGTREIPAANDLYDQAVKMFWEGKGWAHTFISTSYEKERQACMKFMQLIQLYPQSTKIAMSAYYIAEINKEYFKENTLAVYWYERAWTWDPHLPEPARFQAATVYDVHLHNYAKAVECYRLSMKYDPTRLYNYEFSRNRIAELTGQK